MGKVGSAKTAISTPRQNLEIQSLNDKVFDAFADDIDKSDRSYHEGERRRRLVERRGGVVWCGGGGREQVWG